MPPSQQANTTHLRDGRASKVAPLPLSNVAWWTEKKLASPLKHVPAPFVRRSSLSLALRVLALFCRSRLPLSIALSCPSCSFALRPSSVPLSCPFNWHCFSSALPLGPWGRRINPVLLRCTLGADRHGLLCVVGFQRVPNGAADFNIFRVPVCSLRCSKVLQF